MGRAKVPIKLIDCPKSRNATFIKRRKGLVKKTFEFATLCGVDVCLICFGPQGDRNHQPEIWPNDALEVKRIIDRYAGLSKEDQGRRKLDLLGFLEERKKKLEDELNQKTRERADMMYPAWDDRLNQFSVPSLQDLLARLDLKIEQVGRRIELISSQGKQVSLEDAPPQTYLNHGMLDMYEPVAENEGMPVQPLPIAYMKPMDLSYFPNIPNHGYSSFNNTNNENILPPPVRGYYVNPGIGTLEANTFQCQNGLCDAECLQCIMRYQASLMGSPSSSNLNSGSLHKLLLHQTHHMNHGFSEFQMIQTKRGRY